MQETSKQSNSRFIEIANEQSFVQCKKNSEAISISEMKTTVVKQSNNPQWVS